MALKMGIANNQLLETQISSQDPDPGSDNYFRSQRYRHMVLHPDQAPAATPPTEGQIWPRGNFTHTEE